MPNPLNHNFFNPFDYLVLNKLFLYIYIYIYIYMYVCIKVTKHVCYTIYNSRTAVPILIIFIFLDSSQAPITE